MNSISDAREEYIEQAALVKADEHYSDSEKYNQEMYNDLRRFYTDSIFIITNTNNRWGVKRELFTENSDKIIPKHWQK